MKKAMQSMQDALQELEEGNPENTRESINAAIYYLRHSSNLPLDAHGYPIETGWQVPRLNNDMLNFLTNTRYFVLKSNPARIYFFVGSPGHNRVTLRVALSNDTRDLPWADFVRQYVEQGTNKTVMEMIGQE